MSVECVGQFDIVLFLGVFYHLKNPFADLQRVSKIAKEMIIVETHMDALDYPRPAMVFYPTAELADDPTNWWGPNEACVKAMLKDSGFQRCTRSIKIEGYSTAFAHQPERAMRRLENATWIRPVTIAKRSFPALGP